MQLTPKVKGSLIAVLSVFLSACNITKVPLTYCPASTHGAYTTKTLKVGAVYDDRHNEGDLTNDPREIGEFSWNKSIAPSIYYGTEPITNTVQTALNMSLQQAGYKLTPVHPDRILYTRIVHTHLRLEAKNNLQRTLYSNIEVVFAVTAKPDDGRFTYHSPNQPVLWRKTMLGEGSVVVERGSVHKSDVKKAFNNATDDLLLQLERSQGFNRVLR
ncbi:MAG TPA: hypothetical protein VGV92_08555 [Gammaproteobacteria bacterium]|nr:hypothetical protein [Gammaproteobacteria bacterium]